MAASVKAAGYLYCRHHLTQSNHDSILIQAFEWSDGKIIVQIDTRTCFVWLTAFITRLIVKYL